MTLRLSKKARSEAKLQHRPTLLKTLLLPCWAPASTPHCRSQEKAGLARALPSVALRSGCLCLSLPTQLSEAPLCLSLVSTLKFPIDLWGLDPVPHFQRQLEHWVSGFYHEGSPSLKVGTPPTNTHAHMQDASKVMVSQQGQKHLLQYSKVNSRN